MRSDYRRGHPRKLEDIVLFEENSLIKLITKGAIDANAIMQNDGPYCGCALLHLAVWGENSKTAEILLSNGARVNAFAIDGIYAGCSALHLALWNKSYKMAELLLLYGADPNAKTADGLCEGLTPLHIALNSNSDDEVKSAVKLLLKHGADPNLTDSNGVTTEDLALERDNDEVWDVIARKCLIDGILFSDYDYVKNLLDKGADIDEKIDDGQYAGFTLLHLAVLKSELEIASILLEYGADREAKVEDGPYNEYTPLDIAIREGYEKMKELLLSHGAKVGICIESRITKIDFKKVLSIIEQTPSSTISHVSSIQAQDFLSLPKDDYCIKSSASKR